MGLYFFHILSGGHIVIDEEGMLLRDLRAAKLELRASAIDLISGNATAGDLLIDTAVALMNDHGEVLDVLSVRECLH